MYMLELLSIPAIVLAVEAVKLTGLVPSKYCAVLAVGFGALFGLAIGSWIAGAVIGLSASGLYSGAKAMLQ